MQLPEHTPNERHFLSKRQRYQQVPLPDEFFPTKSWPATGRLSKALTALGRLLRTQDSLWFITDPKTRDFEQDTATQQR